MSSHAITLDLNPNSQLRNYSLMNFVTFDWAQVWHPCTGDWGETGQRREIIFLLCDDWRQMLVRREIISPQALRVELCTEGVWRGIWIRGKCSIFRLAGSLQFSWFMDSEPIELNINPRVSHRLSVYWETTRWWYFNRLAWTIKQFPTKSLLLGWVHEKFPH